MPFTKGKSGNPKGTKTLPKELRWNTIIEQELSKPIGDITTVTGYESTIEYRHALIKKYVTALFTKGEIEDLRKFLEGRVDREDGKPKQQTELTGKDGKDLFTRDTFKLDQ